MRLWPPATSRVSKQRPVRRLALPATPMPVQRCPGGVPRCRTPALRSETCARSPCAQKLRAPAAALASAHRNTVQALQPSANIHVGGTTYPLACRQAQALPGNACRQRPSKGADVALQTDSHSEVHHSMPPPIEHKRLNRQRRARCHRPLACCRTAAGRGRASLARVQIPECSALLTPATARSPTRPCRAPCAIPLVRWKRSVTLRLLPRAAPRSGCNALPARPGSMSPRRTSLRRARRARSQWYAPVAVGCRVATICGALGRASRPAFRDWPNPGAQAHMAFATASPGMMRPRALVVCAHDAPLCVCDCP